jgi:hypothetical protein
MKLPIFESRAIVLLTPLEGFMRIDGRDADSRPFFGELSLSKGE